MADPRGCVNQGKPLDGEVWTVEVGESKQKWVLHQNLLCNGSAFFRSAVKKEWNYDRTRTIPMPDDDADVFQVYAQWLYQAKILVRQRNEDLEPLELDTLTRCYIFGEKIQDAVFQNATIDSIFAHVHQDEQGGMRWYLTDADTVYDGTPEGSPLRTLIVDMFAYHGGQTWIKAQRNVDFLVDLAKNTYGCEGATIRFIARIKKHKLRLSQTSTRDSGTRYDALDVDIQYWPKHRTARARITGEDVFIKFAVFSFELGWLRQEVMIYQYILREQISYAPRSSATSTKKLQIALSALSARRYKVDMPTLQTTTMSLAPSKDFMQMAFITAMSTDTIF